MHMEKEEIKNFKFLILFVLALSLIISVFFGAVFGFLAAGFYQKSEIQFSKKYPFFSLEKRSPETSIIKQKVIEEDSAVTEVVEKSAPAVVSIVVSKDIPKMQDFFSSPFGFNFPNFFSPWEETQPKEDENQKEKIGGGTGFLITANGMIVTNKHVVADETASYTVLTNDNQEYEASVLARDPNNDIAIIKISGENFPILELGDSESLKIGQSVIAIGNSLGEFSNTVSRGIVSGLKRNITASGSLMGEQEKLNDIIQTDAAINPGNSGGPLLDITGNVIGINVAMAQGAQNIGFAIPSNNIKRVVDQVKSTGKISTPYLGIRYVLIDKGFQKANSLPFAYGALVSRGEKITDLAVIPGSPADLAGLVENDIILELNETKIDENNSLGDLISQHNVGEEVVLKIWHKGNEKNVKVKLEERK